MWTFNLRLSYCFCCIAPPASWGRGQICGVFRARSGPTVHRWPSYNCQHVPRVRRDRGLLPGGWSQHCVPAADRYVKGWKQSPWASDPAFQLCPRHVLVLDVFSSLWRQSMLLDLRRCEVALDNQEKQLSLVPRNPDVYTALQTLIVVYWHKRPWWW